MGRSCIGSAVPPAWQSEVVPLPRSSRHRSDSLPPVRVPKESAGSSITRRGRLPPSCLVGDLLAPLRQGGVVVIRDGGTDEGMRNCPCGARFSFSLWCSDMWRVVMILRRKMDDHNSSNAFLLLCGDSLIAPVLPAGLMDLEEPKVTLGRRFALEAFAIIQQDYALGPQLGADLPGLSLSPSGRARASN